MELTARLQQSINRGEAMLEAARQAAERRRNVPSYAIAFNAPDVPAGEFAGWHSQALVLLKTGLGADHDYTTAFTNSTTQSGYSSAVRAGVGILKSALDDLQSGHTLPSVREADALSVVMNICDRFHRVARQMRRRHAGRETLRIVDEYDVQDLMHALLLVHFEDVRAEDASPSHAGANSRVDFVLKNEGIVVEVKKTRDSLTDKNLGEELMVDSQRYETHPDCKTLVCFVYDPEDHIKNPRGLERDLTRDNPLPVRVFIRPA